MLEHDELIIYDILCNIYMPPKTFYTHDKEKNINITSSSRGYNRKSVLSPETAVKKKYFRYTSNPKTFYSKPGG